MKIYTLILTLMLGTVVWCRAQKTDNSNYPVFDAGDSLPPVDAASKFFNSEFIEATKGPFRQNVIFIHNNSQAYGIDKNGTSFRPYKKAGQCLDGTDDRIDLTNHPEIKFTGFRNYVLTGITFNYAYIRNIDSVPGGAGMVPATDTLIVYIYQHTMLKKELITDPDISFPIPSAMPVWKGDKDSAFLDTVIVLLSPIHQTHMDGSAAWGIKNMKIAIPNIWIGSGNVNFVTAGFEFRAGASGSSGLMFNLADSTQKGKVNYFGLHAFQNNTADSDYYSAVYPNTYNNAFLLTDSGYISGSLLAHEQFIYLGADHPDIGGTETAMKKDPVSVYPCPADIGALISIRSEVAMREIMIFDATGKMIPVQLVQKEKEISFTVKEQSGLLMLKMIAENGQVFNRKLVVQD